MTPTEAYINPLKLAEHQFRLACTVHLGVSNGVQSLDVPVEWTFGCHRVSYEDFGLRSDQAELAASQLEMTATLVVAGAIRDAIVGLFPAPKDHADHNVRAAYQISRLIRNAFAHSFIAPRWSVDADCRDMTFTINGIIELNTTSLHDSYLNWRHYGGPLAIFAFGRFVREILLNDRVDPQRAKPPFPTLECYQQGRLILHRTDEFPMDTVEVGHAGPGERLDLGGGHHLFVGET